MKRKLYSTIIIFCSGLIALQYQACGKLTPSESLVLASSKSPSTIMGDQIQAEEDLAAAELIDTLLDSEATLLNISSLDVSQKSNSTANMQLIALNDSSLLQNKLVLEDSRNQKFPVWSLNEFSKLPALHFGSVPEDEHLIAQKSLQFAKLSVFLVAKELEAGSIFELSLNTQVLKLSIENQSIVLQQTDGSEILFEQSLAISEIPGDIITLQISENGEVSLGTEMTAVRLLEGKVAVPSEPQSFLIGRQAKFKLGTLLMFNKILETTEQQMVLRALQNTWFPKIE